MTSSIFSKVYSYRERENKNSKENFLIEIFAHCLEVDKRFLSNFLGLIALNSDDEISIETQVVYDYGRPDLEINLLKSKTCILVECKVEHYERDNQLEDYMKILLEKDVKQKHLVYLTKYYENKEITNPKIAFEIINWTDIYKLINDDNHLLTLELKTYLKDENMEDTKNFDYNDITSLMTIAGTITKMDAV